MRRPSQANPAINAHNVPGAINQTPEALTRREPRSGLQYVSTIGVATAAHLPVSSFASALVRQMIVSPFLPFLYGTVPLHYAIVG
jgi:hypothetical protein